MVKKSDIYNANQIEVLEGLDPVRRRPGMYTDTSSPIHLLQELIDNGVDEALSGYATNLIVTLHENGAFTVADNGRGMPIDMHAQYQRPAIDLILTRLHSGAKFSKKAYGFSGGLHGVGISVVNALSQELSVRVIKKNICYDTVYRGGECITPLRSSGEKSTIPSGTIVFSHPDQKYFDKMTFSLERVRHLLKTKALLCKGLSLTLESTEGIETWYYPDGMKGYFQEISFSNPLWAEPWTYDRLDSEYEISVTLQWASELIIAESFVNLIPTVQGGSHVQAVKLGLLEALREYVKTAPKSPREKITLEDVSQGLNYLISLKMHDPNFQGQTKEKLGSLKIANALGTVVKNTFLAWLYTHHQQAQLLVESIDRRQEQRLLSESAKSQKKSHFSKLPAKLSDCTTSAFLDRELYLVEGDSAGGSAKQARDKRCQAILPLRGKVLNTWEMQSHKIYDSQNVKDIMSTIGVEPMSHDLSGLRYNRICLLADADSDGSHIVTLLFALFLKHFPQLVRKGHLYVAQPPLYRLDIGKQHFYVRTHEEQEKILAAHPGKAYTILRFKGLGEMSASQLRTTTLDPLSRTLIQLVLDDKANEDMDLFMSKTRAQDRKKWIEEPGESYDGL
jgi:topoisomerase-4 subunit B